jgi:hypothetical protein
MLLTGIVAFSQQQSKSRNVPGALKDSDLFWVNAPWKADDAPYIAISTQIDAEIAKGKSTKDIIHEKDQLSSTNPKDSKLAYAWAYAALQDVPYDAYVLEQAPYKERSFALIDAIRDKPLSYEYARIQFLTTSMWAPVFTMANLAKRLLARNPNDDQVKYRAIGMLTQTGKPEDEDLALEYAKSFLKRYPQRFSSQEMIGFVHGTMFLYSKNINMGDQAIAELEKALKLLGNTPVDQRHRADVEFLINATSRQIAKIKAGQK